jgi:murein DD-endopeptidase MepM/ murein hydrolase activator NlpD
VTFRSPSPRRRALAALVAGVVVVGAAAAGSALVVGAPSASERKAEVDRRLQRAQDRLQAARAREQVLTSEVSAYNARIRTVEARLGPLQGRLGVLESEVAELTARLATLDARLLRERTRLNAAEDLLAQRRRALADRLREIYARGEPDPIMIMLSSGSLTAAVETGDFLQRITDRDGVIVTDTREFADQVRRSRDAIRAARDEVKSAEERAAAAAAELRGVTTELQTRRDELARFRGGRQRLLSRVRGDREDVEAEARDLQRRSAALAARIVSAQATGAGLPSQVVRSASSRGFIWPVAGPMTSGFGPRWGRMHEGVDIGVGEGTPVAASAAGRVIIAGWSGGYGNLVVIDHGGGISTAYAHNSRLVVSVGQSVAQGSIIAASGNTGHSTGPHVHFEIRINGAAVDPLPYL